MWCKNDQFISTCLSFLLSFFSEWNYPQKMELEDEIILDSRNNLVGQLHYAIFPTNDNDTFMEIIYTAEAANESKDLLDARHGDRLETALQRWGLWS